MAFEGFFTFSWFVSFIKILLPLNISPIVPLFHCLAGVNGISCTFHGEPFHQLLRCVDLLTFRTMIIDSAFSSYRRRIDGDQLPWHYFLSLVVSWVLEFCAQQWTKYTYF